jgi:hypothetical protein
MKNLQKELNAIAKLKMITGDIFLSVELKVDNYKELDLKSDEILNSLETPKEFKRRDNLFYSHRVQIFISFTKI